MTPSINVQFSVAPELSSQGIKVAMAVFSVSAVTRRQSSPLKQHIKNVISQLNIEELLHSPILEAYKKFHQKAGLHDVRSPAEHLLKLIQKSGMIPNINKVVDCYNIVSAETLLAIGAHDLAYIRGNIRFKTTDGSEKYRPLLKQELEKIQAGEYACMDDEKIICRMDIKQCDETKVGDGTTQFLVYVQGNSETSEEYVLQALRKVCENIQNYCNGEYVIV